jgi:hypothetical protein
MPETPDESTDQAHDSPIRENAPAAAGAGAGPPDEAVDGEIEDHYEDEGEEDGDEEEDAATRRPPWHFKVMLGATVIYLGYRSYQGITWLIHHA